MPSAHNRLSTPRQSAARGRWGSTHGSDHWSPERTPISPHSEPTLRARRPSAIPIPQLFSPFRDGRQSSLKCGEGWWWSADVPGRETLRSPTGSGKSELLSLHGCPLDIFRKPLSGKPYPMAAVDNHHRIWRAGKFVDWEDDTLHVTSHVV